MRILVGVDWSDEAFAAVEQIGLLYKPDEVVLVHGVDLGILQSPLVAAATNLQGYDEFRQALMDAGRQAVERCRTLLPAETPSIRRLCEVQHPAAFILDSAAAVKAALIAMGTHDHSRITEVFAGSVSHRILLHATVPTLIVKGKARPVTRVLMSVEGREDAIRLHTWLTSHPFKNPVAVTILSVVPSLVTLSAAIADLQTAETAALARTKGAVVTQPAGSAGCARHGSGVSRPTVQRHHRCPHG